MFSNKKEPNFTCERCGVRSYQKLSHIANGKRFCSLACRDAGHSRIVTCENCNVEFRLELNRELASKGRYCSSKCRRELNCPENRFWSKVNRFGKTVSHVDGIGNCWEWTGFLDECGYGVFRPGPDYGRNMWRAHRFSWLIDTGNFPDALVLHKCDNPACVRPSHLFLGTNADNCADKFSKGRQAILRGEQQGRAKLTNDKVLFIRESSKSVNELSTMFGVGKTTIQHVLSRDTWKHI